MPYIYLIISVFTSASSSILGKFYNRKNEGRRDSGTFYNFFLMISVCCGWGVMLLTAPSFDANVLLYAILFAVGYSTCNLGLINALKHGPATLTSLFISLSMILTTVWGFLFWDAALTLPVAIGLVLVIISIILCIYTKSSSEKAVSLKWLIYVSLAFFGNAGCAIIQRTQQMNYNGQHGNLLMFTATAISTLIYLFVFLKSDRTDSKIILRSSWWLPVCAGILNVVLNICVMLLALTELSSSLVYPVIGAGGLAVVTLLSLLMFKEKMNLRQWLGVAVGAVAVVLLSL